MSGQKQTNKDVICVLRWERFEVTVVGRYCKVVVSGWEEGDYL